MKELGKSIGNGLRKGLGLLDRAFAKFMDNATDSGIIVGTLKVSTIIVIIPTAIAAGAINLIINHFSDKYDDKLENLSNKPTTIFHTVADCTEAGYTLEACQSSKKIAHNIANTIGSEVRFDTLNECEELYGGCEKKSISVSGRLLTAYKPAIMAWQAAMDDINESVPLYEKTGEDGVLIRKDGETYYPEPSAE